ncbi:hypothetical protein Sjap_003553 [Stephania japonica]|uniref:Uncharacterized protein n=1 Tax=Stephania japonica TaxID=461633 RepID=A0AAP0KP11_9MAGN
MLDELSIMDEYWSELEETLEVSLHESDIIIAQNEKDEARKKLKSFQKGWRNLKRRARKTNLWCW